VLSDKPITTTQIRRSLFACPVMLSGCVYTQTRALVKVRLVA